MNNIQKLSLKLVSAKPRKARQDQTASGLREQPKSRVARSGRNQQQD